MFLICWQVRDVAFSPGLAMLKNVLASGGQVGRCLFNRRRLCLMCHLWPLHLARSFLLVTLLC